MNNHITVVKCPCNNCSGHIEFEPGHAGETVECPHCGLDTRLFLPHVVAKREPAALIPVPARQEVRDEEECFLKEDGIAVTKTRLMIGNQLFAVANISSVRFTKVPASKFGPVLLIVIGALIALGDFTSLPMLFVAGLLVAGGIWLICSRKPDYVVLLSTNAAEVSGCKSKNVAFITRVVQAINQAIIARG